MVGLGRGRGTATRAGVHPSRRPRPWLAALGEGSGSDGARQSTRPSDCGRSALEFRSMMLASRSHNRAMAENGIEHLRVLIANERRDRLELLAQVVAGLGHEVIAREIDVSEVGAVTAKEHPDVALVGLGISSQHALELIEQIVRESSCPVIALLTAKDPAYVREAARRGVFAYIVDTTPDELQSAIDITLQRFTEYHSLQGAF